MAGDLMNRTSIAILAAAVVVAAPVDVGHAQEAGVDKTKADAFDIRMFGGPPGNKAYACFVRRYDPDHLARHPRQKVSAMKLLVTAEIPADEQTTNYSFRLGVRYRHRPGDFDSSGFCSHTVAEDAGNEMRFGCGSTAMAAALTLPCRKTTNPRSSGLSGSASGKTTSPTRKPVIHWSPAPMTRSSGSTASTRVNARRW
jgi:hypothetical protein